MGNKWREVKRFVLQYGWQKLIRPTVSIHKTAFPKTQSDLEKLGLRFDYAGTIEENGKKYHRFQVQVNAGGKIPMSWKDWRQRYAIGTDAIVTTLEDEVKEAFQSVEADIE